MADPSIERFRRVVSAAASHLEERRQEVNDLNVFPVADGDTGDNMALTLRAVSDELDRIDGQMVDEIGRTELVNALARAALMGARGNSGVILSQIVRGAAEELASRPGELVDPVLVAAAFARAADAAYESVREPAEGTMLTVFREMAHSISRRLAHMDEIRLSPNATPAEQDALLAELLQDAVRDGEAAVARAARDPAQYRGRRCGGLRASGDPRGRGRGPARRRRRALDPASLRAGERHPPTARGQPLSLLHELHRHRRRPRQPVLRSTPRGARRLGPGRRGRGHSQGARAYRRAGGGDGALRGHGPGLAARCRGHARADRRAHRAVAGRAVRGRRGGGGSRDARAVRGSRGVRGRRRRYVQPPYL